MTPGRLVLVSSTSADDIRLFLGGLDAFDVVFLHHGQHGSCWHLAKGLRWPRSADAVVPSSYAIVARIRIAREMPKEVRDLAWKLIIGKAAVLSVDPRSFARQRLPEPERAAFILDEIEEGSLPNRAAWLRRDRARTRSEPVGAQLVQRIPRHAL